MKDKRYTVVCIYEDNNQRYATDADGPTPTDAVINAYQQCKSGNQGEFMELGVYAVFRGSHPIQDRTVSCSLERMPVVRCRAKHDHKFTVVTDGAVTHVLARNAVEAEPGEGPSVAGIFRGHLTCWMAEVDWDRVDAELAVMRKMAA
jgi:hypothetical protein